MPRYSWNRIDVLGGLFFLVIGLAVTVYSFSLKIGSLVEPKSGFFPFLGGLTVTLLSFILIIRNCLKPYAIGQASGRIWPPVIFIAAMIVYVAALEWAGFVLASIFLGSIILWILGVKSWRAPTLSAAFSIGAYILFNYILGVPLPPGVLTAIF